MGIKPREAVETLPKYVPAKSIDSVKREYGFKRVIKLAGNENTSGFSPSVWKALKSVTSYYPDMSYSALKEKLSKRFGIDDSKIVIGNGSFELISLIGLTYLESDDESIIVKPSFGWYTNATLTMGAIPVYVDLVDFKTDLDAVLNAVTDKTKVIWICNPNNPVGTIINEKEMTDFLDRLRDDILVVLDEAYIDFVVEEGFPDTIKLLGQYKNIILLRTFSKLEGLAHFRIGYGFAEPDIIEHINRVKLPINVNGAAYAAAVAAIDDEEFKEAYKVSVRNGLQQYYGFLDKKGLHYIKSNTNFILFDTKIDSSIIVDKALKKGILVRDASEFGYPTYIRVSIGSYEENQQFIDVLEETLT